MSQTAQSKFFFGKTEETDQNPLVPPESFLRRFSKKYFFIKLFLTSLIVMTTLSSFLVASITLGTVYFPQTFSFVPAKYRIGVNKLLIRLNSPKNTGQIILVSLEKIKNLQTFQQKFFVEGSINNADKVSLRLDGLVDLSNPQNPTLSQTASAIGTFDEEEYQVHGNIKTIDQNIYFKFNFLPNSLADFTLPTDKIVGNWYHSTSDELAQNQITLPSVRFSPEGFERILINHDYLVLIDYLGQEVIEGKSTYHLRINKSFQEISPLISEIITLPEEVDQNINTIELNLWIDSQNFYPYRGSLDVSGRIPNALLSSDPSAGRTGMAKLTSDAGLSRLINLPFRLFIGWEVTNIYDYSREIISPYQPQPLGNLMIPFEELENQSNR